MKFFINTKLDTYQTRKSGSHYVKVSVTEVHGMFTSLGIVDTGKTSIQSFADTTNEHIYGLTSTNNYTEDEFFNNAIYNTTPEVLFVLQKCVKELDRSFRNHTVKNNIDVTEQGAVYQQLKEFRKRFEEAVSKAASNINNNTNNVVNEWKSIDDIVNEVTPDELNNVVVNLNEHKPAIFNGREYRIIEENNRAVLQYREIGNENRVAEIPEKQHIPITPVVVRKKEKLAYMVDTTGLSEFAEGQFYPIIENNGDYYVLLNDDGEKRNIHRQRLQILEVFTEPPVEEEEFATA